MRTKESIKKFQTSAGRQPIDHLLSPFRVFMQVEASGGILLIAATLIAIIWANSPWSQTYLDLWQLPVSIKIGAFALEKPLLLWINDGLMAMFFFVVGLEIKFELLVGELATFKLAALPIAGAIGGMLLPAIIYLFFSFGTDSAHGWGIPMATDIAFALGVLALFGKRVPTALKIFLAALAILDDLGTILVIAFFYTSKISYLNLAIGAVFLLALIAANRLGVRSVLTYGLLGIGGLWLAFLLSGVHPTVAGVLAAFCIPARTRIDTQKFIQKGRETIDYFERSGKIDESILSNRKQQVALLQHKFLYEGASTPLQRLKTALHPWVICLVMPVFALANAGISLSGGILGVLVSPESLGILFGLLIGKQVGIFGCAWLAVKSKVAVLPKNVSWNVLYGVSWLGGIGFTMSLFIASLAFRDQTLLLNSKIAILGASLLSAVGGCLIIFISTKQKRV